MKGLTYLDRSTEPSSSQGDTCAARLLSAKARLLTRSHHFLLIPKLPIPQGSPRRGSPHKAPTLSPPTSQAPSEREEKKVGIGGVACVHRQAQFKFVVCVNRFWLCLLTQE